MNVVWTREALRCLEQIEEFIARDDAVTGEKFVQYLLDRGESVSENPLIGRIVPELSNPDFREIIAKGYRIVYRIRENRAEILTVFEGHKLLHLPIETYSE